MNNIYAIILRYNSNINQTLKQFNSVIDQVNGIVYIDNGSKEINKFKEFLKKQSFYNKIFSVFNSNNKGLGYAQNQGIKIAFSNGASHILLLDHDSILEKNFVKELLFAEKKFISEGIRVGLTGPIFINSKTNKQYPLIRVNGFKIKKFVNNKLYNSVSYTISSGSLIRKEVLIDIGLMNDKLFIDFVDNEWCWRARFHNYEIIITSKAKMNHLIGDREIKFFGLVLSSHQPIRIYYSIRNTLLTLRIKHFPIKSSLRAFTIQFLKFILISVRGPDRLKYLNFGMRGIIDGIKNISGEYRN